MAGRVEENEIAYEYAMDIQSDWEETIDGDSFWAMSRYTAVEVDPQDTKICMKTDRNKTFQVVQKPVGKYEHFQPEEMYIQERSEYKLRIAQRIQDHQNKVAQMDFHMPKTQVDLGCQVIHHLPCFYL